jgi:hypothetical protein
MSLLRLSACSCEIVLEAVQRKLLDANYQVQMLALCVCHCNTMPLPFDCCVLTSITVRAADRRLDEWQLPHDVAVQLQLIPYHSETSCR